MCAHFCVGVCCCVQVAAFRQRVPRASGSDGQGAGLQLSSTITPPRTDAPGLATRSVSGRYPKPGLHPLHPHLSFHLGTVEFDSALTFGHCRVSFHLWLQGTARCRANSGGGSSNGSDSSRVDELAPIHIDMEAAEGKGEQGEAVTEPRPSGTPPLGSGPRLRKLKVRTPAAPGISASVF
jgi:hypothetical protein